MDSASRGISKARKIFLVSAMFGGNRPQGPPYNIPYQASGVLHQGYRHQAPAYTVSHSVPYQQIRPGSYEQYQAPAQSYQAPRYDMVQPPPPRYDPVQPYPARYDTPQTLPPRYAPVHPYEPRHDSGHVPSTRYDTGHFQRYEMGPPPPPAMPHYLTPSHQGYRHQQPVHTVSYTARPNSRRFDQPSSRPPPTRPPRFSHFCESCSKGFDCEEEYDIHVAETHVLCTFPGCTFAGREELVRAHKLTHAVNTESAEEVAAWVAMRRFKFPKKVRMMEDAAVGDKSPALPPPMSSLEKHLRTSMRQAAIEGRKRRLERETKQPCIHWERNGRCKFGDGCSFAHEKVGVCTFFVNHGKCRHGDACKYKHVRRSSKELDELRNPHGQLLKKLLGNEVNGFEGKVLQAIRHAVNSGFYQNGDAQSVAVQEPEDEIQVEDEIFDYSDDDCGGLSDPGGSDYGGGPDGGVSPISDRIIVHR